MRNKGPDPDIKFAIFEKQRSFNVLLYDKRVVCYLFDFLSILLLPSGLSCRAFIFLVCVV